MATTPSTIVIYSTDKLNLPIKWALVVCKQLFQYGVKSIDIKDDKILLSLTYSPRAATLKRKFGNLPLRYMRAKIESNEDFRILESVVKKYRFNLVAEEEDESLVRVKASENKFYLEGKKNTTTNNVEEEESDFEWTDGQKFVLEDSQPGPSSSRRHQEEGDGNNKKNKIKVLENILL